MGASNSQDKKNQNLFVRNDLMNRKEHFEKYTVYSDMPGSGENSLWCPVPVQRRTAVVSKL